MRTKQCWEGSRPDAAARTVGNIRLGKNHQQISFKYCAANSFYILFGNNHNYHFHRRHLHQTLLIAEKNLNSFSAISTTNTQYYQVFDIWKYQVLPKWNILNVEVKQTNSIFLSLVAFKLNSCFESFVFFWFYVLLALCYPFATFPQVFFLNHLFHF